MCCLNGLLRFYDGGSGSARIAGPVNILAPLAQSQTVRVTIKPARPFMTKSILCDPPSALVARCSEKKSHRTGMTGNFAVLIITYRYVRIERRFNNHDRAGHHFLNGRTGERLVFTKPFIC